MLYSVLSIKGLTSVWSHQLLSWGTVKQLADYTSVSIPLWWYVDMHKVSSNDWAVTTLCITQPAEI